jgi:hypothetical protein
MVSSLAVHIPLVYDGNVRVRSPSGCPSTSWTRHLGTGAICCLITACSSQPAPTHDHWTSDISHQAVVDTSSICPECRITEAPVATISSTDSASFFLSTRLAYLPATNRFYAAPLVETGRIAEFDSHGNFLRLLLREGEGPGELGRIRFLVPGLGDTIVAIGSDFRVVKLSTTTGSSQSARLPANLVPSDVMMLPNGWMAMSTITPMSSTVILLDESLSVRFAIGDSIGADSWSNHADLVRRLYARLGSGADGSFWECGQRYRFWGRRWSPDGKLLDTVTGSPAWFPEYSPQDEEQRGRSLLSSQAKPYPLVTACWEHAPGLLWVAAMVPDPDWKALDPVDPPEPLLTVSQSGIPSLAYRDWSMFTDGIIEIVDLEKRRVVARIRTPSEHSRQLGQNLIDRVVHTPDGDFEHRVLRLALKGYRHADPVDHK